MTTAVQSEATSMMIPIEDLVESERNTRRTYDAEKMVELADSIRRLGVLTPLLARPRSCGHTHPHCYEIAAGHRRYRAAKIAGVAELPVRVSDLTDAEFLEVLLIENLQREDVHELDEANGYRELMKTGGYDVATLAEKVGKSEGYIYARLKLCDLQPEIEEKFYSGELTAGHAILLARLPVHEQMKTVKEGLYREFYDRGTEKHVKELAGVRALGAWIQSNIHMELSRACFSPKDADLLPAAGACELCPKRSGFSPQLFPELGKKDVCTDRKCFDKKIDAYIKQKVDSGAMVALSDDYSNRQLPQWYSVPNAGGAGAEKCDSAVVGICVDGYEKGKTKKVCVDTDCKVHYRKSGKPTSGSRAVDAREDKRDRERKAKVALEKSFRAKVYDEICEAVTEQIQAKQFRLKGAPLVAIADAVFDRLDYRDRSAVLKDLAIEGNDCENKALRKRLASMSSEQLAGILVKLVARRNLQVSEYQMDFSDAKELLDIAEHYQVDHARIRGELHTSAKSKPTTKLKGKKK